MISPQEAEDIILNLVNPITEAETVRLDQATRRVLAQTVSSQLDFPYWDNSAMDGYGVRFEDVTTARPSNPISLDIIEEIPAGYQPQKSVKSGQACRIFTGAMLPVGVDTIIMQEKTQRKDNQVIILEPPKFPQEFVRKQGKFYQAGNPLLTPGITINPPEISVLATAQCPQINVYRRPRVAVFSTGDELVSPAQPLNPGQIVDSNQYALESFLLQNNAIPLKLGIIPDDPKTLKETINEAINSADFVLSTGGVSVGDYDYIDRILGELGGEIKIRSVAIKPGKPLTTLPWPTIS